MCTVQRSEYFILFSYWFLFWRAMLLLCLWMCMRFSCYVWSHLKMSKVMETQVGDYFCSCESWTVLGKCLCCMYNYATIFVFCL